MSNYFEILNQRIEAVKQNPKYLSLDELEYRYAFRIINITDEFRRLREQYADNNARQSWTESAEIFEALQEATADIRRLINEKRAVANQKRKLIRELLGIEVINLDEEPDLFSSS